MQRRGLAASLLFDELMDHVCCQVESYMQQGEKFESAYEKSNHLLEKSIIKQASRNRFLLINYHSVLTKWLLYLCVALYIISWFLKIGPIDWLGGISSILIGFVFLRYGIVLKNDKLLKRTGILSVLSGLAFVFILSGSVIKYISINYQIPNIHYSAMLVFGYLVLCFLSLLYYRNLNSLSGENSLTFRFFIVLSYFHLAFAILGMSTFFIEPLIRLVPILAGIIIIFDVLSFVVLPFIKRKGKYLMQGLVLGSFVVLFPYFPFKSMIGQEQYTVYYKMKVDRPIIDDKVYIYLNYYKYGKECLPLYKINDSVFLSQPLIFHAGGIDISYKIKSDSFDLNKVLLDKSIPENKIRLNYSDTIFSVNKP